MIFTICNSKLSAPPVGHDCHVLCGLPECLDDCGVADDHDDAGDQEGDHQLVEGEVDPDMGTFHHTVECTK